MSVRLEKLVADLLAAKASRAEMGVSLAVAMAGGQIGPVGWRALGKAGGMSHVSAQAGVTEAEANNRLERIATGSGQFKAHDPRWTFRLAGRYLAPATRKILSRTTPVNVKESFSSEVPYEKDSFTLEGSGECYEKESFTSPSVVSPAPAGIQPVSEVFPKEQETMIPEGEETPISPFSLTALHPEEKPPTKRDLEQAAAKVRRAETERIRDEKRVATEAEKARKTTEREEARRRKAEEAQRAGADAIDLDRYPFAVRVLYRKAREVLGHVKTAPTPSQQKALVVFLCEVVEYPKSDWEPPTEEALEDLLDDLDAFRADWWAGKFCRAGEQPTKPYVGDLRNHFETSRALRRKLIVAMAKENGNGSKDSATRKLERSRANRALIRELEAASNNRPDLAPDVPRFLATGTGDGSLS